MKTGLIECFAGISGDMLLGALVDVGVPTEVLQGAAVALKIGAGLRVSSVERNGIRAIKVDVLENGVVAETAAHRQGAGGDHHHEHNVPGSGNEHRHGPAGHAHLHGRKWQEIRTLIARAELPEGGMRLALRAFELLAEAEGKVHGIAPEEVHFHEVGAVDTITDIVCASVGLAWLGVDQWRCSPVNVGSGFVDCAHGRMPVPAPATAELLKGAPLYSAGPQMELTTPTGAAMLRALGCEFDAGSPLTVNRIGYGAGGHNPEGFANVLRISVGTLVRGSGERSPFAVDRVVVLECALDDATPQVVAHAMELALENGALDVMAAPVGMKKGRLGTLLTVLVQPEREIDLERLLFRETTTLGIRRREEERVVLEREFVTVETAFGRIRVKVASAEGEVVNAMPEYEDCRRSAREHSAGLRVVIEAAMGAYGELVSKKVRT
jgi:pyridinium-3,5-bisthiocarboxylic acid mononucleotide nickel chelatase